MPRRKKDQFPPEPKVHGGKVRVWWNKRWWHLGHTGDPAGWRAKFDQLVALWKVDPKATPDPAGGLTVAGLLRAYLASADAPREDRQRRRVEAVCDLLGELHPATQAADFGPAEFLAWQTWVCGLENERGESRFNATSVRHFRDVVKRVWKWGVLTGRVAAERWQALRAVPPPRFGEVRPAKKVRPADPKAVEKALPLMPAPVRAVVLVLRHSAARPSEVLTLRPEDVDATGETWVLRPQQHKGTWRGRSRAIYLNAEARAALEPFLLNTEPGKFVFRPEGKRVKKARYDHRSLGLAVRRACRRAGVAAFAPYQLRHLRGTEVRRSHGLEHARAVLGQSYKSMTDHYSAFADAELAAEVVKKAG